MSLRALSWVCLLHNSDEIDKYARTVEPGTEAADHIVRIFPHPSRRELFAAGAGAGRRDARNWLEAIRYLNMDI